MTVLKSYKSIIFTIISIILNCYNLAADTLAIETVKVGIDTGVSTDLTHYTDVITVNFTLKDAGNAMLLASFSTSIDGDDSNAYWRMRLTEHGSTTVLEHSYDVQRHQKVRKDVGAGSVVHIFSGLSAGSYDVTLEHRAEVSTAAVTTSGVNLVAIPLVTEETHDGLANAQDVKDLVAAGTDVTPISVLSTSIDLPAESKNRMFIATTLDAAASGEAIGLWRMQYKLSTDTVWIDLGRVNEQYIANENDVGIVTLYGLVQELDQGTYDIRVTANPIESGQIIYTKNGTLSVISLSYLEGDDETGTAMHFESFFVESDGDEYDGYGPEPIDGVIFEMKQKVDNMGFFTAMNLNGFATAGSNQSGEFDIAAMDANGNVVEDNEHNQRLYSSRDDLGSVGSIGYFETLKSGTYDIVGHHEKTGGQITSTNVNFMGFSAESKISSTPALGFELQYENGALCWSASGEVDVKEYRVYYFHENKWLLFNTVIASGESNYTLAVPESNNYKVSVVDYSGVVENFGVSDAQKKFFSMEVYQGWNLLSVPYRDVDFSTLRGVLWHWEDSVYKRIGQPVVKDAF